MNKLETENNTARNVVKPLPRGMPVSPKPKIYLRDITGTVAKCVRETSDTWTLHISVKAEDKHYLAGQFLSIAPQQFPEIKAITSYFERLKGKKEPIRAYSMSSAPHEPYVAITIKPEHYEAESDEFPPILSPLLASSALQGREIVFRGFTGAYVLPENFAHETNEVIHVVSGSGVVPNYSIIKDELYSRLNKHVLHTLIYVNKTYEDIIYLKEVEELAAQYPGQLRLVHLITREQNPERYGANFYSGRPTLEFVKKYIRNPETALVYACGAGVTKWQKLKAREAGVEPTPRFMEAVGDIIHALGIDKKRYKHEFYG